MCELVGLSELKLIAGGGDMDFIAECGNGAELGVDIDGDLGGGWNDADGDGVRDENDGDGN